MPGKMPKATDQPLPASDAGEDTEGHNLWINPSASREMAAGRNKEIERQARERQRAKEAKGR